MGDLPEKKLYLQKKHPAANIFFSSLREIQVDMSYQKCKKQFGISGQKQQLPAAHILNQRPAVGQPPPTSNGKIVQALGMLSSIIKKEGPTPGAALSR